MSETHFVLAGKSLKVYDQRNFRRPTQVEIKGGDGINVSVKRDDDTGEIIIKVYG